MSKKVTYSPEVVSANERYRGIRRSEKHLECASVCLSQATDHAGMMKQVVPVFRVDDGVEMGMDIRGHWQSISDYSFRLFDKAFMGSAIGRLDIVGGAHDNLNMGLPLKDVRVETPHFHDFHASGYERAYKTQSLLENENLIRKDRDIGLRIFLEEECIRYEGQPSLSCDSLIQPDHEECDPLQGVSF